MLKILFFFKIIFIQQIYFNQFLLAQDFSIKEMNKKKEQLLSSQAETPTKLCLDSKSTMSPVFEEGLFIDIDCGIKCHNSSMKVANSNFNFLPSQLGLGSANGFNKEFGKRYIYQALAMTLKTSSQKHCLEVAINLCGDISKVEETEVNSIHSGDWETKQFPTCKNNIFLASPFDPQIPSKKMNLTKGISNFARIIGMSQLPDEPKSIIEEIDHLNDSTDILNCKNIITSQVCYGDCVFQQKNDQWVESLSTPDAPATGVATVCADDFKNILNKYKNLKLSDNIKQNLCESYFWKKLVRTKATGSSCSAVRGEVDCTSLIK